LCLFAIFRVSSLMSDAEFLSFTAVLPCSTSSLKQSMVLQEGAELILHGDSLLLAMHKAGEGWMDGWSEREKERERERTASQLLPHKSQSSATISCVH
jgi:hypothetical protein